ncbi:hypothetical protein DFJ74DRAFT_650680 [Hyaloraphidium curvatum]|nr:hypothetical protein DFJ74DRAFT_650680 [Hyaloraphidium curvatum]
MADRLDLSLDDLIKQSKQNRPKRPQGGGGNRARNETPARSNPRNAASSAPGGKGAPEGAGRIRVSGILTSVSDSDLMELFGQVGPVLDVKLRDGTAVVTFARANDAIKAKKRYDRVTLDDRPMSIEVIQTKVPQTSRQTARAADNTTGSDGRGSRSGRGGGRGGRAGRSKGERAQPKSKEDLDNELDTWRSAGTGANEEDS